MNSDTSKPDDADIPVLENPLTLEQLEAKAGPSAPQPDLTDHELLGRLLQNDAVQAALDDMAEDLQKLVSWKIEELLKEQLSLLIKQAAEDSAPKLAEDIRTHLQLALPGLLANMVELANKPDRRD